MKERIALFYAILLSTLLFSGCKKEDDYNELMGLADLKIQEAVKLAANHPCSDLKEWYIDTLYYTYVAVHPSFENKYKQLLAEARELQVRAQKVYKGPPTLNDPGPLPPHFGLRCIAGHVKVARTTDLELEEINQRLHDLFTHITTFFDDVPCTDASKWGVVTIRKDCEFVPILMTDTKNFAEFGNMMEQYNQLYHAKGLLVKGSDCPSHNDKPAKGVVCENGKPKVTY
ncbi:hypothetical protein [Sphingobacterium thalpophilum]|uniref:hypothetical protein n=1 Tax=Sphingobacterium thalpophilum TaxID=259 RepID=UPI003C7199CC